MTMAAPGRRLKRYGKNAAAAARMSLSRDPGDDRIIEARDGGKVMTRKFSLGLAATAALGVLAATATVQPVRADKPKEIVVVGTPKKAGHFSGVRNWVGQGRSERLYAKKKDRTYFGFGKWR